MELGNKIKRLREFNHLSQEYMAEQMDISTNSYGRIERNETKPGLERLKQIADIFKIDVVELIGKSESALILLITSGDSSPNNYYGSTEALMAENEKLKLMLTDKDKELAHKDEMLAQKDIQLMQKDKEITLLEKLLDSSNN